MNLWATSPRWLPLLLPQLITTLLLLSSHLRLHAIAAEPSSLEPVWKDVAAIASGTLLTAGLYLPWKYTAIARRCRRTIYQSSPERCNTQRGCQWNPTRKHCRAVGVAGWRRFYRLLRISCDRQRTEERCMERQFCCWNGRRERCSARRLQAFRYAAEGSVSQDADRLVEAAHELRRQLYWESLLNTGQERKQVPLSRTPSTASSVSSFGEQTPMSSRQRTRSRTTSRTTSSTDGNAGHPLYGDLSATKEQLLHGRTVDLHSMETGSRGLLTILPVLGHNRHLRELNLWRNGMDGAALDVLLQEVLHPDHRLRLLNLRNNELRDEDVGRLVDALVQGPSTTLRTLILDNNPFGVEGARSLARLIRSPHLRLRHLSVQHVAHMGTAGVQALAAALRDAGTTSLRSLDLWGAMAGDGGAVALFLSLQARTGPTLDMLNLNLNGIGRMGMQALLDMMGSSVSSPVRDLRLAFNRNMFRHQDAWMDVDRLITTSSGLQRLDLDGNALSLDVLQALATALTTESSTSATTTTTTPALQHLSLARNQFDNDALPHLLTIIQYSRSLVTLDLRYNQVRGPDAARRLAQAFAARTGPLKHVRLQGNPLPAEYTTLSA